MSKQFKKGKGPRGAKGPNGLDENALSQLTSKIDQGLSGKENKRKKPPTDASSKQHQKKQRGPQDAPPKEAPKYDRDALLAEIKALGGDEQDLDLINAVDSSDEEVYAKDSKTPLDKKLRDEIAALSKELGLAELVPSEADEEEVNEDEEDGDEPEESSDDDDDPTPRKVGNMTFEPRADWHATKLRKLPSPTTDQPGPFVGAMESLKRHAQTLLDTDAGKYRSSVFASSSHKFLSTIMSTGTLNDKVSALTLAVQESPIHNIRAFDALMTLASKNSRAQAIGAIGALVDLLGPGTLLPSNRRLRTFNTQPGLLGTLQQTSTKSWTQAKPLPGKLTEDHLISWIYEDWLKDVYFKIIQLLERWCSDEIEYSRTKALDFVYALLKEKPEQESNLLRLLVNKLGDRDRKISSRASYLLLQLQNSHPGMKPIILRTIEQEILLHPSQDHRSKYYAINTLNQTILSSKEPTVAETLVRIYFELFVTLLKVGSLGIGAETTAQGQHEQPETVEKKPGKPFKKPAAPTASEQEIESADKLVSAILTGVNRAAPFVSANDTIMENHLDTLFKIAHSTNFNTGIQALLLIQHLSTSKNLASDRFYRTLYESLLDPRLVTSSKQALYLNLLLRSLKNDVDVRRVKAFAKRMLQIAELHQPPFVCGLLYVISHLRETFPDLSTLINDPEESIFDDEPASDRPVYDGRKRDPEHSNASRSCLWEMIPTLNHYHPSVNVFASALLDKNSKVQKPDMESHSLIRFLDKFVYRNAKATDGGRGASIMQPLRATKDLGDIWLGGRGANAAATSVNSSTFWNKKVEDVAAEDVFFHNYFQHMAHEPKQRAAKTGKAGEDDEDAEEDEIWKALVSAQPDVEDDGSDVGFDDLDESDMASLDGSSPALSLEDDDLEDAMSEASDVDDAGSDGLVQVGEDESEDDDMDEASKAKKEYRKKQKERKKALKALPMFASVDDYAELLGQEEEGI